MSRLLINRANWPDYSQIEDRLQTKFHWRQHTTPPASGMFVWNLKFVIWNHARQPGFSAPRIAEVTTAISVKTIAATNVRLSAATNPAAFTVVKAMAFTPV